MVRVVLRVGLLRRVAATVWPPPGGRGHSEEKAASKAASGGVMAFSERM
ncbi:hypothetical protein SAMN05421833_1674 [Microbispora rosea]|uniref:Uncharacterized protein n=1 Tax=Microbispora rosea TaxID=58117 RepID=A0A1N7HL08_9ACTN|nr:hypothetical protein SAMN05421833_1674 [Microbispora rosea]